MIDILVAGKLPAKTEESLNASFATHRVRGPADLDRVVDASADALRGMALGFDFAVGDALMARLPKLEIVANFGVGYDAVDVVAAAAHGVIVTNTPDVLTEEVADTTIGLLLMTVRELPAAERFLRAGKWTAGPYPSTRQTLRDRTVGIAGLGRIGLAIARRLDAMLVPVVYHSRQRRPGAAYRYYDDLRAMAADVDVLIAVLPGGAETTHVIDAPVLAALGRDGVLINIGRGNAVDEAALIAALKDGTIFAAGLDVFEHEPHVPPELLALPNAVLLPHVASASAHTRDAMGALLVENLQRWFEDRSPPTPVPETPWPPP